MPFKNKFLIALLATVLSFTALTVTVYAQTPEGGGAEDPCATELPDTATEAEILAQRQACDEAILQQDQQNLQEVRDTEDGPDAQLFYDACSSEYEAPDDGAPPGGGGQYVPVQEVEGQLLSMTTNINTHVTNIDTWTGGTYDLNVMLCMYLQAIKRVQYSMEDLAFIREPDMRRQAATKVEEYRQGVDNLLHTGYTRSGEQVQGSNSQGGSPLYPENLPQYLNDAQSEASGVFLDALDNSGNSFKEDVKAQLFFEENNDPTFNSTITADEYNNFMAGGSNLTDDQWWLQFLSSFDPNYSNSPEYAYLSARNTYNRVRSAAESIALEEYSAGNGYLPVRTCAILSTDGKYCVSWKTIAPGKVAEQMSSGAVNYRLEQYSHPEIGQVGDGNEPTVNDVSNYHFTGGTGGGDTGGLTQDYTADNGGGTTQPPVVDIFATQNRQSGQITVSWASTNAVSCRAGNDWVGSDNPVIKLVKKIKNRGENLKQTTGELSFSAPLNFRFAWARGTAASTTDGMSTTTNTASTSLKLSWRVPISMEESGPISLRIYDGDHPTGYTLALRGAYNNASAIVTAFRDYERTNSKIPIYERYQFGYYPSGGYLTVQVKEPVYEITCRGQNGKSVTASSK
ncbi:MAG: hypothetical protein NTY66_01815 [Candidatus Vogelbacteria bacterium]|nr:hypothetical protein [Candidatus Vogelbacteria bacterium]